MSPSDRCDEVIRLIDEVLAEDESLTTDAATNRGEDPDDRVEALPGHWGVYYLKPSA